MFSYLCPHCTSFATRNVLLAIVIVHVATFSFLRLRNCKCNCVSLVSILVDLQVNSHVKSDASSYPAGSAGLLMPARLTVTSVLRLCLIRTQHIYYSWS